MKNAPTYPTPRLKSRRIEHLQTQSGKLRGLYAQRSAILQQLAFLNEKIKAEEFLTYQDLVLFENTLNQ